jgi:uncharacterized repeat protein (TIGR02543 family)
MAILTAMVFAACSILDGNQTELNVVVYDRNGATSGTVPFDANEYESGDTVTVLGNTGSLVRTGYTYTGWNTAADGSGTTRAQGATFSMGNSTVRLYAKWTPDSVPTYTVTYNANGATGGTIPVDATNYEAGQTVTAAGNTGSLTKTSYTFEGWNTTSDGSGTDRAPGSTFSMGSVNVTLYAKWLLASPANLSVTDSTTFLRLEWDPVSLADGYYVEWAKDVGGVPSSYSRIAEITETSYDHTGAFPQAAGWYRVQAYTGSGEVSQFGDAASGTKTGTVDFEEDWEDGAWNDTWVSDITTGDSVTIHTGTYFVTPGTRSLRIADNGDNWTYFDGLHYEFPGGVRPGYARFYIRKEWDDNSYPWINFGGDTTAADHGSIYYKWGETDYGEYMSVAGGGSVAAAYGTFQLVEFRNIDFTAQKFDFYVGGALVTADVPFYNAAASFTRLYISVGWWSQPSYIDKIELRS